MTKWKEYITRPGSKPLNIERHNIGVMHFFKFILSLTPILTFGQGYVIDTSFYKIHDYSNSRFNIDSNGFNGSSKADTTYYTDKKIAVIGHFAIARNSRMSGTKFGQWIKYYHNGQVESKGNFAMYSLLYYRSPKKGFRNESTYKTGKWTYFYENGQIKAVGTYKIVLKKANTGVDTQFYKLSRTTSDWKFFNPDGTKSHSKNKIMREIEYTLNCD